MEMFISWLDQYGYLVLFILLMFELILFGVPTEIIMSYAGFLVYQGTLNWVFAILASGFGTIIGISIAYWIGAKLGTPFFNKHGSKIHMGPDRIEKVSQWFNKYGNKLLIIAYFIPGVRHVTGYFSGITRIPFKYFAIYAYTGAALWVTTFISIGKLLGPEWEKFHVIVKKYIVLAIILFSIALIFYYLYKNHRQQIFDKTKELLVSATQRFYSSGRVKFLIIGMAITFFIFVGLMIGLIQDYMANEFNLFNETTSYLVHRILGSNWGVWLDGMAQLASLQSLLTVAFITLIWIIFNGKERVLEMLFLISVTAGGIYLDDLLRMLFAWVEQSFFSRTISNTFPSGQTLSIITVFGFLAFMLVRHYGRAFIRTLAPFIVIAIGLLVGIDLIFENTLLPSDIVAGYIFGGVWLTLNMVMLEVFRLLR